MTPEDTSIPRKAVSRTDVDDPTEAQMWTAELLFLSDPDPQVRAAQFAIRTAVRAHAVADLAGSDPIDELLDARSLATSESSRRILESAIGYLRIDQILGSQLDRLMRAGGRQLPK